MGFDDYQKPSRQNRRQKRGWKRKPKSLTMVHDGWHDAHVPETKGVEIGVSNYKGGRIRRFGGFFTSFACTASSMAGLAGEGQPSPVPLYRYANLASACHPIGVGCGIETAYKGVHAMRLTALGKVAHTLKTRIPGNFHFPSRLTVYRSIRRVSGPVLAYRLAFAGEEVRHG